MTHLVFGRYESDLCPNDMILFNMALGASESDARKKATKANIEFCQDVQDPSTVIYTVTHGDPLIEFRLFVQFGKSSRTVRSGKPVEALYTLLPFQPGDTVATIISDHKGVDNALKYEIEYNFVESGFLLVCTAGDIRAKRWYRRITKS